MSSSEIHDEIMEYARGRVGRVLRGKYSLDRLVGVGGMAAVYAATHTTLGTTVAIKILHPQVCVSADSRRRFRREGRVANAIGHPGVVHVIDDDIDDDGGVFLVMELLTGASLEKIWEERGRKLPVEVVLTVAGQILDVLAAAHAKGIAHRDVKPENIFVTERGDVKLVDFGVARMRDMAAGSIGTRTGMAIGTPGFMAPEQALGKAELMDALCDVYAVGAVMFTLLAGRYIHEADNPSEALVLAATQQAPPLASVAPDVPPPVARIVDCALRFARAERWQSAAAMRAEVIAAHESIATGRGALPVGASSNERTAIGTVARPESGALRAASSASVLTPGPQSLSLKGALPTGLLGLLDVRRWGRRTAMIGALAVGLALAAVVTLVAMRRESAPASVGTDPSAVASAPPTAAVSQGSASQEGSWPVLAEDAATPGLSPTALPLVGEQPNQPGGPVSPVSTASRDAGTAVAPQSTATPVATVATTTAAPATATPPAVATATPVPTQTSTKKAIQNAPPATNF